MATDSKAYVRFSQDGRPWHEAFSLWLDRDAEPRYVLPRLVEAYADAVKDGLTTGLGRPARCASYFVATNPKGTYFHGRELQRPLMEGDKVKSGPNDYEQAVTEILEYQSKDQQGNRFGPMIEFFYQISCLNPPNVPDGQARTWEVEVLQVSEEYRKEAKIANLLRIYPRASLDDVAKAVRRVASFAEVGGKPEVAY